MAEESTSTKAFRIVFPFLALIALIIFVLVKMANENYSEEDYFKNLDLKLTGVIKYIGTRSSSNGFGVVGVIVLSSNKSYVDERKQRKNYYCLVKGDNAELYQLIYDSDVYNVGDTILVDSKEMIYSINKNGDTRTFPLKLYDNEFFWDFVEKDYQKF